MKININGANYDLNLELAKKAGALNIEVKAGDVFDNSDTGGKDDVLVIIPTGYQTEMYYYGGRGGHPFIPYSNDPQTLSEIQTCVNERGLKFIKNINTI